MPDFDAYITLDFSNADDDGLLFARAARASAPLVEGMTLLADDYEGHQCVVRVERVDGAVAYLAPDWDTWTVLHTTAQGMLSGFEDVPAQVAGNGHAYAQTESTNLVPTL
jgi:hypothetical protein